MTWINQLFAVVLFAATFKDTNGYTNVTQRAINREECEVQGGYTGTCMAKLVCNNQGGDVVSDRGEVCEGIKVCCYFRLQCGQETSLKKVRITTPTHPAPRCSYTITKNNRNVCQLRIDMHKFHLHQPVVGDTVDCTERLEINGMILCGINHDQHLYVPFDDSNIDLVFHFPESRSNSEFDFTVTQLECPGGPSALPSNNNDLKLLAPIGCAQYFTERSGFFETFNYNSGLGPYMGRMNYAICFQRQIHDSAIQFVFKNFGLPNHGVYNGYDSDCRSLIKTIGKAEDYLLIPGSMTNRVLQPTYFCGHSKTELKFQTTSAGPFVAYFNSDEDWSPDDKGFRIEYNIL